MGEAAHNPIPPAHTLAWPTLRAVRELGDSATIQEITPKVVGIEDFSEEQQAVPHGVGPRSELEYRLAWARTYLKNIGALENTARGVWSVTELGQKLDKPQAVQLIKEWRAGNNQPGQPQPEGEGGEPDDQDYSGSDDFESWKDVLLTELLQLAPDAFERLSKRVLREAGFSSVEVTGKSGDGGIDGVGVYQISLLSFQVFFQCKRYTGSVGAGHVRDFRGAMTGRGDKGLLLTTGAFTTAARTEATRDGAPPIDLVDGNRLCQLLKDYSLGVSVQTRSVEEVTIDESFFNEV